MTLLFTGLRSGNAKHIRHEHFGARAPNFLDIPKAKGHKPSYIPISEPLAFILEVGAKDAVKRATEDKCLPWTFPSSESASGCINTGKRIRLACPHDMRHMYRLMLNGAQIPDMDGRLLTIRGMGSDVHDRYLDDFAMRDQVAKSGAKVAA